MTRPWSRRKPWPYDCALDVGDGTGEHGLMLVPGQDGLAVARSDQRFGNVVPTTYAYGASPPDRETTWAFGRLTGGMGEDTQAGPASTRYRYALGVDCSIAGFPRLGPLFTAETFPGLPASTYPGQNDVRQFVVFVEGTTRTLFALVRQHVYRRTGGAWVLSHDFTAAGAAPMQAVVFQGTAGTSGLWVATDVGQLWKYDGTNWVQAVLPAGAFAERVEVVGHQLFIGSGVSVRVCTTGDPLLAASWGGAIRVGSQSTSISGLRAVGDLLVVFKWDGVYTLNADGTENDLFPELRAQEQVTNGRMAVPWKDHLWFAYGDAYYRMDAAATLEPIGPERLVDNTSPVRGRPVSGAGHNSWFFYLLVNNPATGAAHLLKFGTWRATDDGTSFDEAWHGAIASWSGKVATRVDVVQFNTDLDPTLPGPALWVGFQDGTVQWTPLPSETPDPAQDAACRFQPSGTVYAPLHDAGFAADVKAFHGVTYVGPTLTANQTAQVAYRWVPTIGYAALGSPVTATGTRVEFPDITGGFSRDASATLRIDFGVTLATTASTATPVLEGVALHEAVRPALRLEWAFRVGAGNRVVRRDGVVDSQTPEATRALLRTAAGAPGHTKWRLPEETVAGAAVVELGDAIDPDRGRDGPEGTMSVRVIQFR